MSSSVLVAKEAATVQSRLTPAGTKLQKSVDVGCVSALGIGYVTRTIRLALLCVSVVSGLAMSTLSR